MLSFTRLESTVAEHEAILARLAARDPAGAADAMGAHIRAAASRLAASPCGGGPGVQATTGSGANGVAVPDGAPEDRVVQLHLEALRRADAPDRGERAAEHDRARGQAGAARASTS
jgi:hypothetical protein